MPNATKPQGERAIAGMPRRGVRADGMALRVDRRDRVAAALRRIEALARLLGAPADGEAGALMECAVVVEAADIIAEEARRIRADLEMFAA